MINGQPATMSAAKTQPIKFFETGRKTNPQFFPKISSLKPINLKISLAFGI